MEKRCSRCDTPGPIERFIKNRNICKSCDYSRKREKYHSSNTESTKTCNVCGISKNATECVKNRNRCNDCNNKVRKAKYENNEDHRVSLVQRAIEYKQKRALERRQAREAELRELSEKIGEENTICKYCTEVRPKTGFRENRLKCKDCERDAPLEKFKRRIRCRIYLSLSKKTLHTVEYLGCNASEYLRWISDNSNNYTLDNHGSVWHIDHVIPLSKFDLEDPSQQLIAFNWRNTMALEKHANLAKNNRIIVSQVQQHYTQLLEYHKKHNIDMPQEYVDLFARHLVAGSPLELSTTTL